ncbi:hypothetical protein ACFX2C_028961 [Malus domestica]
MVSDVVGQTGSEVRGEVLDGGINNGDIDIPDLNEEVEPEVSREEFLEVMPGQKASVERREVGLTLFGLGKVQF